MQEFFPLVFNKVSGDEGIKVSARYAGEKEKVRVIELGLDFGLSAPRELALVACEGQIELYTADILSSGTKMIKIKEEKLRGADCLRLIDIYSGECLFLSKLPVAVGEREEDSLSGAEREADAFGDRVEELGGGSGKEENKNPQVRQIESLNLKENAADAANAINKEAYINKKENLIKDSAADQISLLGFPNVDKKNSGCSPEYDKRESDGENRALTEKENEDIFAPYPVQEDLEVFKKADPRLINDNPRALEEVFSSMEALKLPGCSVFAFDEDAAERWGLKVLFNGFSVPPEKMFLGFRSRVRSEQGLPERIIGVKYALDEAVSFVFGIIGKNEKCCQPFGGATGFCTFAAAEGGLGYWLMYVSAEDGVRMR